MALCISKQIEKMSTTKKDEGKRKCIEEKQGLSDEGKKGHLYDKNQLKIRVLFLTENVKNLGLTFSVSVSVSL